MESSIGFLGVALALLAIFMLYIGGVALVLRFVDRLRPTKSGSVQDSSVPASTS
ncbi:MAG: hypothetical protein LJE70_14935 [Chromatiaceae bacterium]|jgi:predicted permease|nr:hypothetical protein [Chromatiaceae bacterium]